MSETRKDQKILIRISDNGRGIDKDHADRILEPFLTTKRLGEGTGQGLRISHGIVREHGGELSAANGPKGGAMFSCALPAA